MTKSFFAVKGAPATSEEVHQNFDEENRRGFANLDDEK
jgi:hypothetical protein